MEVKINYICNKMKQLREERNYSLQMMANSLGVNKSSLSRIENGQGSDDIIMDYFNKYCEKFRFTKEQKEFILKGFDVILLDTSALLSNPQILEELNNVSRCVIIPDIVITELTNIKRRDDKTLGNKAWLALTSISNTKAAKIINYNGLEQSLTNDQKIIEVAKQAANDFNCNVNIISNDIDHKAYLKDNQKISVITLANYVATIQELPNMEILDKINNLRLDNYDSTEVPDPKHINAYLTDGLTLIISTVRSNMRFEQKCEKIKWLIKNGADVNKRDNGKYYFPPLTHAVQRKDVRMVKFLLEECKANPNIGSRNPYSIDKIRQRNEGNMPLMVACYGEGASPEIVKILCSDERTSLNQQDGNGYTAYIKASIFGHIACRNILEDAGADLKIVDINGMTGEDHYDKYLEQKALKNVKQGTN